MRSVLRTELMWQGLIHMLIHFDDFEMFDCNDHNVSQLGRKHDASLERTGFELHKRSNLLIGSFRQNFALCFHLYFDSFCGCCLRIRMEQPQVSASQEQFEVELEFVLCLANPEYINCECAVLCFPMFFADNKVG